MKNNIKIHEYKGNLSTGNKGGESFTADEISRGAFLYTRSSTGIDIYTPEDIVAPILLEPVRNLRWKFPEGGENTSSFSAGTVLLIPADQRTIITWPGQVKLLKVFIGRDQNCGQDAQDIALRVSDTHGRMIIFYSKQCLRISELILEQLRVETPSAQSYLESLYSALLYQIASNAATSLSMEASPSGLRSYACRQIEDYMKENFRNSINVPQMASLLNMSAGHFSMCFRKSFGLTPYQYLMGLRLDEAEKWLIETDMPISEIAIKLNFSSQSHFTTALKKYRNLTPGEVRRRRSKEYLQTKTKR
ncbi:AraC family transcriptional regulator [Ochrobactrum chromiisoli]|uniref:AraC family transcriptional regulator n=1 Tax=Ochrobactrum chromiisoli TaxID=2993941 RepID=A0ABT3QM28_9HYPH|nr:AraC family transcriptional regulator [Ochrobactrum chromiisoli]MCX2696663.1 AraC family transcriptional regulator [Ochrobactrum chromiisoli]